MDNKLKPKLGFLYKYLSVFSSSSSSSSRIGNFIIFLYPRLVSALFIILIVEPVEIASIIPKYILSFSYSRVYWTNKLPIYLI